MTELFLVAHIGGRGVAICADAVDSVVDIAEVVSVPGADRAVRGLAALRSRVVTVVDTGVALGLAPLARTSRAVVTRLDGHHYAFLVDSLEDVAEFERKPLPSGAMVGEGWRTAAVGLVEQNGEPLLVIDPGAIVPTGRAA